MMQVGDGFRDDWRWSRAFTFGGFIVTVAVASWLTFKYPDNDGAGRKVDSWLTLAGALALYYMGRAGADAISRRQSVVSVETTKMQVSATRKADLDDAAG